MSSDELGPHEPWIPSKAELLNFELAMKQAIGKDLQMASSGWDKSQLVKDAASRPKIRTRIWHPGLLAKDAGRAIK